MEYQPDIQVAAMVIFPSLNCLNETVQKIIDEKCPWLYYHLDNLRIKQKTITYHLQEVLLACCFETTTKLIGELFVTTPSDTILALLSFNKIEYESMESVLLLLKSQKCMGVFEIYTWQTLSSHLLSLAKNEPKGFLSAKLREERELGFVTNYLNQICLAPNVSHDWIDAVDCCPRVNQLSTLVSDLKKLLIVDHEQEDAENDEPNSKSIISTIGKWIQDNGVSNYVSPVSSELACGAKLQIQNFLSSASAGSSQILKLENVTFNALCTHEKEFIENEFDLDSKIKVCEDNSLTFLFTKKKRIPVVITRSFFTMAAEETTNKIRLKALHSYYVYLQFLNRIGLSDTTQVNDMVARMQTFGMTLCGLDNKYDGSYRLARNNLFPAKYFLGAKRDTLTVTKRLGLTVNDTLFVYHALGEHAFNQVLKAYKLQTPSPLSPGWECTGIPGYIDCDYSGGSGSYQTKSNSKSGQVSCIAFDKPWHPFHGIFVCNGCHRKVERAELLYYEANDEHLNHEQRERMEELNKRKKNRREVAILKHDITTYRRKRNMEFALKTENERRTMLDKRARQAKERGDVKKSQIECRKLKSKKKKYKEATRQKMVETLMTFGQRYHSRHVYNNHLIAVCDAVLEREIELGNETMMRTEKLGLLKYYKVEYDYVIARAGYKRFGATKQYVLVDEKRSDEDIQENLKMNRNIEELIQVCVSEVYNVSK